MRFGCHRFYNVVHGDSPCKDADPVFAFKYEVNTENMKEKDKSHPLFFF